MEIKKSDKRIKEILAALLMFAKGDNSEQLKISDNHDEIDSIMMAVNSLRESVREKDLEMEERKNKTKVLIELLHKYSALDFSERAVISKNGDEIDSIAAGLNAVIDEWQSKLEKTEESVEKIRTIFKHAPDAIIVINSRGVVEQWNPAAEEIFGWSEDEVMSKPIHTIIIPENYREKHLNGMNRFLKTGKSSVTKLQLKSLRKNNKEIDVELTISYAMVKGEYLFIGFLRDISKKIKAEQEIGKRTIQLETANKELEEFAYTVSHDLRGPLRTLEGFSKLLFDKYNERLDSDATRWLNFINKNALKMDLIINDLLEFSIISRQEIILDQFDTKSLIDGVMKECLSSYKKIKVEPKVDIEFPTTYGDRSSLRKVWQHLINNALKFSSKKDVVKLEIQVKRAGNAIIYSIEDNGTGFNMEHSDKIFGVFERLHKESEFEGNGIGLAIVSKIIEKHNGKIWIESKVGGGTKFYFELEFQDVPIKS